MKVWIFSALKIYYQNFVYARQGKISDVNIFRSISKSENPHGKSLEFSVFYHNLLVSD